MFSVFGTFSLAPPPAADAWSWTSGPSATVLAALDAVIAATRTYADCSHGNLSGEHYQARADARNVLLAALDALDAT